MNDPMTVGDLINALRGMDPAAVVMLDCDDAFYSGPLTADKLSPGTALKIGPFEFETPGEDARGRPEPVKTIRSPGLWRIEDESDERSRGEILDRRPCLTVAVDGRQ